MNNPVAWAVEGLVKPIVNTLDKRSERKHKQGIAKLENAAQQAQWKADAAKQAAEQKKADKDADVSWADAAWANSGWKDELNTVALWAFFFLGCVPVLQDYIALAIVTMSNWPLWLQAVFVAHSLASIGIKFKQASLFKL